MRYMKQMKWWGTAALLLILPLGVVTAQETASAINGTVVDSDGNPLAGATVVVTHEPTGQVKTLTTNDEGRYSARGLRVGGPYRIEVSNSGYSDAEQGDVFVQLGETQTLDAVLVANAIALDTVQAVGVAPASAVFNPDTMGAGISVSQEQIEDLPTVSRSVTDFVRLDSRVNIREFGDGISVSGVHNRYNNFTIDGVPTNDEFGLEAGGFSGISQPFSLDTISELNVQISPYDVTLSNFTGANINAVTKSGTNEFEGRISGFYRNDSLINDELDGDERDIGDYTDETYNISLGGPIIKDKLFFFINYEKETQSEAGNTTDVPLASIQEVQSIAQSVWGMVPGEIVPPTDLETVEESILIKLDWNINDFHRAALRYTSNDDDQVVIPNYGFNEASLGSHWYINNYQNDSLALNVYSDWTANFSTEFRYSSSSFDKIPKLGANLYPQIEVNLDGGDRVYLGTEQFRHANELTVDTDTFFLAGEYFMGNHTLKFGVDRKSKDIRNLFVNDSLGIYEFDGIENFANGFYDFYQLRIGSDPSVRFPTANWSWSNTGYFIQDNWTVNDRLTVQFGLRLDSPDVDDTPRLNQDFVNAFGFPNNSVLDSSELQPRIGFNYDMSDEYYMQLRGGIGLFSGSTPDVWLSNSFTNTGGDIAVFRDFDNFGFTPDPNSQPLVGGITGSSQDVDVTSPDFEVPTVLKANIALDAELPWWGLIASAELEYSEKRNEIHYQHLNLGAPTGFLPDGRPSFYGDPLTLSGGQRANANPLFNDVMLLSSVDGGEVKRATFSLEKQMDEHWFARASYTHTDATEVNPGTSSRAISNWNNSPAFDPNAVEIGTSAYEIENAFTMFVNYENNFFGDTMTNIGLVWVSRDGEPFSYTFSNDVNGDRIRDNDLVYVPMVDEYVLADPADTQAFEAFLRESGLDGYRGQVAPKNAFKAPRINQFDIKFQQELPEMGFMRATLFFNIVNVGNLLNDDWGIVRTAAFDGENIYSLEGFDDQGRWILDWNGRDVDGNFSTADGNEFRSRWSAQLGFRLDW